MKILLDKHVVMENFLYGWYTKFGTAPVYAKDLVSLAKEFDLPINYKKPQRTINTALGRLLGAHKGRTLFSKYFIGRNNRTLEWTLEEHFPPSASSSIIETPELTVLQRAKDDFLEDLYAHLRVVGGRGTENVFKMNIKELVDHIYPNDLRLKIINLRLKEEYR